jgi:Fe2+ transport system protein FeoA
MGCRSKLRLRAGGVTMQALSTAESGKRYTIKWMFGNKNVLDFLHKYNFKEGSTIDVIQQNRDWMIIGNDGCRLAIGCDVAARIQV